MASNEPTRDDDIRSEKSEGMSEHSRTGSRRGSESSRRQSLSKTSQSLTRAASIRRLERAKERSRVLLTELPLKFVIQEMKDSAEAKLLMREFVVYIPFVIAFIFFFLARRDVLNEFSTNEALKAEVAHEMPANPAQPGAAINSGPHFKKTFTDVRNTADWADWFEGELVSALFSTATPTLNQGRRYIGGQNELVGKLRVRTFRVRSDTCDTNPTWYPDSTVGDRPCFDVYSNGARNKTTYGLHGHRYVYTDGCELSGQQYYGSYLHAGQIIYPCGGFIEELPFTASYNDALDFALGLREGEYLDTQSTRFVAVEFFTYNAATDQFTLVRLINEVTEGGAWIGSQTYRSFSVYTKEAMGTGYIVYDFFFLLFVLYYWSRFFVDWSRHYSRSRKVAAYIFEIWTFLDLINLVTFAVVFILHWIWWSESVKISWTLPLLDRYPSELHWIQMVYMIQVYLNSVNTILTFLKVLKYFKMNQRLNILSRTLEAASQNIFGVIVIFLLVILAYAFAGMVIYGEQLSQFRNLAASLETLMLTIMGHFDYRALREENRSLTFVYFWSYVVLALFIMLNFITAVITQGFASETHSTRVVPLGKSIEQTLDGLRTFFATNALKNLRDSLVSRTRRLRADMVLDYLVANRQQRLDAEGIYEQQILDGYVEEPDFEMSRRLLGDIIPPTEVIYITDEYLDRLWVNLVNEHEIKTKDPDAEAEARLYEVIREGLVKAFGNVFAQNRGDIGKVQRDVLGEGQDAAADPANDDPMQVYTKKQTGLVGMEARVQTLENRIRDIKRVTTLVTHKLAAIDNKLGSKRR